MKAMAAKAIFLFCIASLSFDLGHSRSLLEGAAPTIFDVTTFGAKADNQTDNFEAFAQAWMKACKNSTTPSKVVIPAGTFLLGPTIYAGPCTSPKPIMVEVLGTVTATVDPSEYTSPEWFTFQNIDGLVLSGNGTFDGQGASLWQYNDCKNNPSCSPLPASLKFKRVNNSVVRDISSVNSKQFHFHLNECNNFTATGLKITAPGNSPNTDGMHIGSCTLVTVTSSVIGTGDDCISIGEGSTNISVSNVTCGPGHGISVGSLGKRPEDQSVSAVSVSNCTLVGTTNGARIKTFIGKNPGEAKNIVYENLVMNNVSNPIIIDQSYGAPKGTVSNSVWAISDVHFRNIKGSSFTNVGVSLHCSSVHPCQGVEVADVNLTYGGPPHNTTFVSSCTNAKATFKGTLNPAACP